MVTDVEYLKGSIAAFSRSLMDVRKRTSLMSNIQATASVFVAAVGIGITALPAIYLYGGWIYGTLVLFLAGLNSMYTATLLHSVVTNYENLRDNFGVRKKEPGVEEISEDAKNDRKDKMGDQIGLMEEATFESLSVSILGKGGFFLVTSLVNMLIIFFSSLLSVLMSGALLQCSGVLSAIIWGRIQLVILLPIAWLRSMKYIGYISLGGVIGIIALIITLVSATIVKGVSENAEYILFPDPEEPRLFVTVLRVYNLGLFGFAFPTAIPTIITGMKYPMDFPRVLRSAFCAIVSIYLLVCTTAYYSYGSQFPRNGTLLSAMSTGDGKNSILSRCAQVGAVIVCACQYMIVFSTIGRLIDKETLRIGSTVSRYLRRRRTKGEKVEKKEMKNNGTPYNNVELPLEDKHRSLQNTGDFLNSYQDNNNNKDVYMTKVNEEDENPNDKEDENPTDDEPKSSSKCETIILLIPRSIFVMIIWLVSEQLSSAVKIVDIISSFFTIMLVTLLPILLFTVQKWKLLGKKRIDVIDVINATVASFAFLCMGTGLYNSFS